MTRPESKASGKCDLHTIWFDRGHTKQKEVCELTKIEHLGWTHSHFFFFLFFWWTLKESHTCDHLHRDTVFLRSARHESDNSSANYTKQQKIIHISVIVERNQTHDSTHFTLHKDKARIGQRKTKPLPYHLQHIMWGWPIIKKKKLYSSSSIYLYSTKVEMNVSFSC